MSPMTAAPQIDVLIAGPVLAPALGAILVLALDALWPRRRAPALSVGGLALLATFAAALALRLRTAGAAELATVCLPGDPALAVTAPEGGVIADCLVRVDAPGALLQALAAAAGALVLVLLLAPPRDPAPLPGERVDGGSGVPVDAEPGAGPGVEVALLLATVTGAAMVTVAQDLGSWLVGLELATLPVVALAVLRGGRRDSGAMPLIMTSVTSFAVAVVGAGLWVTATGSVRLGGVAAWSAAQEPSTRAVLTLGVVLLVAGVAFKLSLVPFHAWTPATYPRAGVIVTALLASVSSIAALGALVVVLDASVGVRAQLVPAIGALAVVSMLAGAVIALRARDPLRLIAWSAVTQGGWVLAPLAAGDTDAAVGYLAVYVVAVATALAVLADLSPTGRRRLEDDRGLLRRKPLHAIVLLLALLTLAGLPPGIAGLLAKFLALRPLAAQGLWWIAVPAVLAAVIGFAVYLRWVALILLPEAQPRAPEVSGRAATAVVAVAGFVLLTVTLVPVLLLGAGTS